MLCTNIYNVNVKSVQSNKRQYIDIASKGDNGPWWCKQVETTYNIKRYAKVIHKYTR